MALRLEAGMAGCWLSVITKGSVAAGWPLGTPLGYSDGKFGQVISLTPFRGIPLGAVTTPGVKDRLGAWEVSQTEFHCLFAGNPVPGSSSSSLPATHVSETIVHWTMGTLCG